MSRIPVRILLCQKCNTAFINFDHNDFTDKDCHCGGEVLPVNNLVRELASRLGSLDENS